MFKLLFELRRPEWGGITPVASPLELAPGIAELHKFLIQSRAQSYFCRLDEGVSMVNDQTLGFEGLTALGGRKGREYIVFLVWI